MLHFSADIFVVLDLTPNYQGTSGPWFSNISVTNVAERLKVNTHTPHAVFTVQLVCKGLVQTGS